MTGQLDGNGGRRHAVGGPVRTEHRPEVRARAILDLAAKKIQRGREADVPDDPERQANRIAFLLMVGRLEAVVERRVLHGLTAEDAIAQGLAALGLLGAVVDQRASEIADQLHEVDREAEAFMDTLRGPRRKPSRTSGVFGYHHCTTKHESAHAWSGWAPPEPLDAGEWLTDYDPPGED